MRDIHVVFIQYHCREDGADLSTLTYRVTVCEREREREMETDRQTEAQ